MSFHVSSNDVWKLLRLSEDKAIQPLTSLFKLCSEAMLSSSSNLEKWDFDRLDPQASYLFENLRRHFVFRLACGSCDFKKPKVLA